MRALWMPMDVLFTSDPENHFLFRCFDGRENLFQCLDSDWLWLMASLEMHKMIY